MLHKLIQLFYISVFVVGLTHCSSIPTKPTTPEKLDLQGHRGARGLAPENTWPAFRKAIEHGMTTLELDTVLTKDGEVIIHHDSNTNPVICSRKDGSPIQSKSLYELTLAELKELDCGSKKNPSFPEQTPVPGTSLITIQEFFEKLRSEEKKNPSLKLLRFNIETKFPGDSRSPVSQERMEEHVKALVQSVQKAKKVNQTTIQSFYLPALPQVKKENPNIKTSALYAPTYFQGFMMMVGLGGSYRTAILDSAQSLEADTISPYFLYVTPDFMKTAKEKDLLVVPWTVNEKKEMHRLINIGVDGIITDYPNRLSEVVQSYESKN